MELAWQNPCGQRLEVKNSIIMDGTHVGHLSYIGVYWEKMQFRRRHNYLNLRIDDNSVKMLIKDKVVDAGQRKLGL